MLYINLVFTIIYRWIAVRLKPFSGWPYLNCGSIRCPDTMHSKSTSDFLFAQPSFVSGAARLLDLFGLFDSYNTSNNEAEADYKALLADWRAVGEDIQTAMQEFAQSPQVETPSGLQYDLFAQTSR